MFNIVLQRQYLPNAGKHAHMISILKPGKDRTLPSSYRLTGKLSENILFSRNPRKMSEGGLLLFRQFAFRTQHEASIGPYRWKSQE